MCSKLLRSRRKQKDVSLTTVESKTLFETTAVVLFGTLDLIASRNKFYISYGFSNYPHVIHGETDQADLAENLALIAAHYWHSLLFTPEAELPKAVEEALRKFGVKDPSHSDVVLTVESFITMLRHATSVENDAVRVEYFKLHFTVYPIAFRQMFTAITSELTSRTDLVEFEKHLRKKLHIDSYSQTNDSMISNAFRYHQDSLHINMFAHTPPLTYLKEISTGRWRVTVGIGEGGSMTCANSPFTTPLTPSQCDHRSDGTRCHRIAMMTCTACMLDYGNGRNFCDRHAQRRCSICGVGSFCTEQ